MWTSQHTGDSKRRGQARTAKPTLRSKIHKRLGETGFGLVRAPTLPHSPTPTSWSAPASASARFHSCPDLHRPPLLPHSRTPPPAPSFTLFHSCLTPPHPHLLQPWSHLHLHTSPPFLHLPAVVCVA
ncbi:unnamed protein product [Gadus morhua 'NCC']